MAQTLEERREYQKEWQRKWRAANPEEHKRRKREAKEKNPEKYAAYYREYSHRPNAQVQRRAAHYRRTFGIGLAEYEAMLLEQDGVCAICGQPETRIVRGGGVGPLSVDHDHRTGKVRMLLCNSCNSGLGHFKDDIGLLAKAIEYLDRWNG